MICIYDSFTNSTIERFAKDFSKKGMLHEDFPTKWCSLCDDTWRQCSGSVCLEGTWACEGVMNSWLFFEKTIVLERNDGYSFKEQVVIWKKNDYSFKVQAVTWKKQFVFFGFMDSWQFLQGTTCFLTPNIGVFNNCQISNIFIFKTFNI